MAHTSGTSDTPGYYRDLQDEKDVPGDGGIFPSESGCKDAMRKQFRPNLADYTESTTTTSGARAVAEIKMKKEIGLNSTWVQF